MSKQLTCPKCHKANTVEFWDEQTKEQEGIKEGDPFISAGAPPEQLGEVEAMFRCPVCNEEVPGTKLIN